MKRTNLVLDGKVLEEAVRLSGEKTYSRTVDRALRDLVDRLTAHRAYLDLRTSGAAWEGDLGEMRRDATRRGRRRA